MKIKTIKNEIVNTDKLSDIESELIELVENSGIRNFAMKHDGLCFVMLGVPNKKIWTNMHLDSETKYYNFISCVDNLVRHVSQGKSKLAIVPNE